MRKVNPALVVGLLAALGLWAFSRSKQGAEIVDEAVDYGADVIDQGVSALTGVLSRVLPGPQAHLTGTFSELRNGVPHSAVDFNYVGGQQGLNLQHPYVRSPVDGIVTFSGGQYGTVKVLDGEGFSHELLHMNDLAVQVGQRVSTGEIIGTMGGRGPLGPNQYAQHVHYQLVAPSGGFVDPVEWWQQRGGFFA